MFGLLFIRVLDSKSDSIVDKLMGSYEFEVQVQRSSKFGYYYIVNIFIIMIKIKTRIILSKYAHREFCSSGGLLSWAYYDISCLNSCRHHLSQFYETTQKYQLVCPTTVHSASKNCELDFH